MSQYDAILSNLCTFRPMAKLLIKVLKPHGALESLSTYLN
jgi:hypothetical protein